MPKYLCALLLGLCVLAVGLPARAQDDAVKLSLCKKILARMLCKRESEFNYAGKPDPDVFVISVFYAAKNSEFLCAVLPDGQVIVQDRTWHPMRRFFPFVTSSGGRCLSTTVNSPECPSRSRVRACASKGPRDARERRAETFWNRPIPKILEEEYKAMSARSQEKEKAESGKSAQPADASDK